MIARLLFFLAAIAAANAAEWTTSSLVMVDDHTLGILYESSQADMVFQKIPLKDLIP